MVQEDISNRIRNKRKALGFTQQKLADKLGISMMTIVRWEKGVRTPNSAILPRLAEVLNTSVEYLMGLDETPAQNVKDLAAKLADENSELENPVSAGISPEKIVVKEGNRTYEFPNNEIGLKALAMILNGGIQSASIPAVSNSFNGENNGGTQIGVFTGNS